ncbi:hypothetical protein FJZ40_03015 [Candidatus Shapirobacteria bacterium]|nr:hypothetical protein [Candidatus Shapirobacteria bacterium]
MIKIRQLVWDKWNVSHIKKHKVVINEAEQACQSPKKFLKTYQERLIVLGKTKRGRALTIVLAKKEKGKYYVVTARDTSNRERRLYK